MCTKETADTTVELAVGQNWRSAALTVYKQLDKHYKHREHGTEPTNNNKARRFSF